MNTKDFLSDLQLTWNRENQTLEVIAVMEEKWEYGSALPAIRTVGFQLPWKDVLKIVETIHEIRKKIEKEQQNNHEKNAD